MIGVTAFARYALPGDDLLIAVPPTITASAEDPAYPASNWSAVKPAKPSKLTTTDGRWTFDFGAAVNVAAFALIYHNFDPGLSVLLEWDSDAGFSPATGSQAITIPEWTEDVWPPSPWIEVTGSPTYRYWRLSAGVGSPEPNNSQALSLGRPLFVGALRDLGNDVRWGVEETEEHGLIEHPTELGVETIYALGGKRRRFSGEFLLRHESPYEHAQALIALHRSALGRVKPWLLIPDVDVNDAWFVRFEENRWSRTYDTINNNLFPFRVQELSRGLPWP